MERNADQTARSSLITALTIVGLGTVITAVIAALWGWLSGDFIGTVGGVVAVGLSITAVIAVFLTLYPSLAKKT